MWLMSSHRYTCTTNTADGSEKAALRLPLALLVLLVAPFENDEPIRKPSAPGSEPVELLYISADQQQLVAYKNWEKSQKKFCVKPSHLFPV